jgi:mannose-6-phosphate isomerase-like protein (cupin superfamily)
MYMRDRGWFSVVLVVVLTGIVGLPVARAAERTIDPTFLYRDIARVVEKPADITTPNCHYKPLFGPGDAPASVLGSVARYGLVTVDPKGACRIVQYPNEDQIYFVLNGGGMARYAEEDVTLKKEDFLYIPATVHHGLRNPGDAPLTVVVMGFGTKGFPSAPLPDHPLKDNAANVPTELVGGHPDAAHFRLLLGDAPQTRNRINVGNVVTSLFLMEIDPGGTNFPHHHPNAEEVYLILDGHGTQVAGGGVDGIAGKRPAKAGDAYFYRLNATVGYYSAPGVKSRLLCVRSFDPAWATRGHMPQ